METIERRQRRSTTIASRSIWSLASPWLRDRTLPPVFGLYRISKAYPLHSIAINAAAAVYAELGEPNRARELLDSMLTVRAGDMESLITAAHIALAQNDWANRPDMTARLGTGIPSGATIPQLRAWQKLHESLGNQQSANATTLEIERQRFLHQEALAATLAPVIGLVQKGSDSEPRFTPRADRSASP